MPAPSPRTLRLNDVFRRFGASRRGSAAIQFALVAPLFFALLFAIVEVAMVFFANQILETGTQDTASSILTHQLQDTTAPAAQAQKGHGALRGRVKIRLSCGGDLL